MAFKVAAATNSIWKSHFAKNLVEKEFHLDTTGGQSLSYRVYGKDLDQKLNYIGFSVYYEYLNLPELGILETELFYCKVKS